jgi:uncharacterized membrane protein YeaQ/YmgE (transglycosylase-associated protein family)
MSAALSVAWPTMGILTWVALGLIAGLAARPIMPDADRGGIVVTIVLGMTGAVVGGVVAVVLGLGGASAVNLPSSAAAAVGAILLLGAYRVLVARRSATW